MVFLWRKQGNGVLFFMLLCPTPPLGLFLQLRRLARRQADGEMTVKEGETTADGQRTTSKAPEGLPNSPSGLQHLIPGPHQKHIVATGVNNGNGHACVFLIIGLAQKSIDIAPEKQGHLPGEGCRAGQIRKPLPLHRVRFPLLLETRVKRRAQVVHIHPADGNALDAPGTSRQLLHRWQILLRGMLTVYIIPHIQPDATRQLRQKLFGIDSYHGPLALQMGAGRFFWF